MGLFKNLFSFKKANVQRLPYAVYDGFSSYSFESADTERLIDNGYKICSIVSSCIRVYQFTFPEAYKEVYIDGEEADENHELVKLLRNPNPYQSEEEFSSQIITDLMLTGNCYIYKVRNGFKHPIELWAYNDLHVTPIPSPQNFIDHYEYSINGMTPKRIETKDIIHLRLPSTDPYAPYKSIAPLTLLSREIDSDVALTKMVYNMTRNAARPNLFVKLDKDAAQGMTLPELQANKAQFEQSYSGEGVGSTLMGLGIDSVTPISANLTDFKTDDLRFTYEARICSVMGVPAEVAGLGLGKEHSTYNNLNSAQLDFTERSLVPLWKLVESAYTRSLANEFGDNITICHDLSDVESLRMKRSQEATSKLTQVQIYQDMYSTGKIERNAAITTVVEFLNIEEETAKMLFPDKISQTLATPEGELINSDEQV